MRLLHTNLFDLATLIASSENTLYPVENLQHIHLVTKWRSTADTGQTIVCDMGSAVTITTVAITAHNFISGAVVKIQGNATDSWGAPSVDETITYSAGIMTKFFTGGSYRYWRFTFEDASNPDEYIEIGRLYLGTYYQVDKTFSKDFTEEKINTDNISFSKSGQVYGDEGIIIRRYALQFPYWANTAKQAIETIVDTLGKRTPLFLVMDEDNISKLPVLYCIIETDQSYSHILNYQFTGAITFREVK